MLKEHIYIVRKQFGAYWVMKTSLKKTFLQVDFAEIYHSDQQDTIQSAYFGNQSLDLSPCHQLIISTSYPTNTITRSYMPLETSCLTAIIFIPRLTLLYTIYAPSFPMLRNPSLLPENLEPR